MDPHDEAGPPVVALRRTPGRFRRGSLLGRAPAGASPGAAAIGATARGAGRQTGRGTGSALILSGTGYAWVQYRLTAMRAAPLQRAGRRRQTSAHGDTNILIMGLDSRLDENGNPLPPGIYDALHAGDSSTAARTPTC